MRSTCYQGMIGKFNSCLVILRTPATLHIFKVCFWRTYESIDLPTPAMILAELVNSLVSKFTDSNLNSSSHNGNFILSCEFSKILISEKSWPFENSKIQNYWRDLWFAVRTFKKLISIKFVGTNTRSKNIPIFLFMANITMGDSF